MCYLIHDTGIVSSTIIMTIMRGYPDAMACVSPNKNKFGILNGYVLTLWKEPLDVARQTQIITQVESTLKQR
jgi:hypothetical protein